MILAIYGRGLVVQQGVEIRKELRYSLYHIGHFDRLGYYNEEQSPKAAVGVQSRTKLKKSHGLGSSSESVVRNVLPGEQLQV